MKKILIIEDDEVIQVILKEILVEEGYKIEAIRNGDDLENKILFSMPDFIITDILLPDVFGFELLSVFKNEKLKQIPKIVISSMDTDDARYFAGAINAKCLLEKPLQIEVLKNIINNELMNRVAI